MSFQRRQCYCVGRSQLEKLSLKRQELEAAGARGLEAAGAVGARGRGELAAAAWQQVRGKIVLHLFIGIQLGKHDNILGSIPNQLGSIGSIPRSYHPKPRPTTPMDLFDMSIVLDQKENFWVHKLFNASNWVTKIKIF